MGYKDPNVPAGPIFSYPGEPSKRVRPGPCLLFLDSREKEVSLWDVATSDWLEIPLLRQGFCHSLPPESPRVCYPPELLASPQSYRSELQRPTSTPAPCHPHSSATPAPAAREPPALRAEAQMQAGMGCLRAQLRASTRSQSPLLRNADFCRAGP